MTTSENEKIAAEIVKKYTHDYPVGEFGEDREVCLSGDFEELHIDIEKVLDAKDSESAKEISTLKTRIEELETEAESWKEGYAIKDKEAYDLRIRITKLETVLEEIQSSGGGRRINTPNPYEQEIIRLSNIAQEALGDKP